MKAATKSDTSLHVATRRSNITKRFWKCVLSEWIRMVVTRFVFEWFAGINCILLLSQIPVLHVPLSFATVKWYNLCLQIILWQTCYPLILLSVTALWCMIIPDRRTQKYSANGIATGFENISLFGLINPTGNKAEERQIIFKSKGYITPWFLTHCWLKKKLK